MEVFFYGLFMDIDILAKNGVNPANPRKAYLDDYVLKIGKRASLIPCKGERAYGMLMTIAEEEIQTLYAEASVADYLPEEVNIMSEKEGSIQASCYNLSPSSMSGTNAAYAQALYELAVKLEFPQSYLQHIKEMIKSG